MTLTGVTQTAPVDSAASPVATEAKNVLLTTDNIDPHSMIEALIRAETDYINDLDLIHSKIAPLWFGDKAGDTFLNHSRSLLTTDKRFLETLQNISATPCTQAQLFDRLVSWVNEMESPYTQFCQQYGSFSKQLDTLCNALIKSRLEKLEKTPDQLFGAPIRHVRFYQSLFMRMVNQGAKDEPNKTQCQTAIRKIDAILSALESPKDKDEQNLDLAAFQKAVDYTTVLDYFTDAPMPFMLPPPVPGQQMVLRSNALYINPPRSSSVQVHILITTEMFILCRKNDTTLQNARYFLMYPPLAVHFMAVRPYMTQEGSVNLTLEFVVQDSKSMILRLESKASYDAWLGNTDLSKANLPIPLSSVVEAGLRREIPNPEQEALFSMYSHFWSETPVLESVSDKLTDSVLTAPFAPTSVPSPVSSLPLPMKMNTSPVSPMPPMSSELSQTHAIAQPPPRQSSQPLNTSAKKLPPIPSANAGVPPPNCEKPQPLPPREAAKKSPPVLPKKHSSEQPLPKSATPPISLSLFKSSKQISIPNPIQSLSAGLMKHRRSEGGAALSHHSRAAEPLSSLFRLSTPSNSAASSTPPKLSLSIPSTGMAASESPTTSSSLPSTSQTSPLLPALEFDSLFNMSVASTLTSKTADPLSSCSTSSRGPACPASPAASLSFNKVSSEAPPPPKHSVKMIPMPSMTPPPAASVVPSRATTPVVSMARTSSRPSSPKVPTQVSSQEVTSSTSSAPTATSAPALVTPPTSNHPTDTNAPTHESVTQQPQAMLPQGPIVTPSPIPSPEQITPPIDGPRGSSLASSLQPQEQLKMPPPRSTSAALPTPGEVPENIPTIATPSINHHHASPSSNITPSDVHVDRVTGQPSPAPSARTSSVVDPPQPADMAPPRLPFSGTPTPRDSFLSDKDLTGSFMTPMGLPSRLSHIPSESILSPPRSSFIAPTAEPMVLFANQPCEVFRWRDDSWYAVEGQCEVLVKQTAAPYRYFITVRLLETGQVYLNAWIMPHTSINRPADADVSITVGSRTEETYLVHCQGATEALGLSQALMHGRNCAPPPQPHPATRMSMVAPSPAVERFDTVRAPTPETVEQTLQPVMRCQCKLFIQSVHSHWSSFGSVMVQISLQMPRRQMHIQIDNKKSNGNSGKPTRIANASVLSNNIERLGPKRISFMLVSTSERTGVVYMAQVRDEPTATKIYEYLKTKNAEYGW